MKNDPSSDQHSLEVMEQKNWDGPRRKRRERRGCDGISVGIVCSSPAGESLINSGLLRNLTDSKDEKGEKTEEGAGFRMVRAVAWTRSRTCCISVRTNSRRGEGLQGSFYGARHALRDHSPTPATSFRTHEESSRARNAFVISLERARILLAHQAPQDTMCLYGFQDYPQSRDICRNISLEVITLFLFNSELLNVEFLRKISQIIPLILHYYVYYCTCVILGDISFPSTEYYYTLLYIVCIPRKFRKYVLRENMTEGRS